MIVVSWCSTMSKKNYRYSRILSVFLRTCYLLCWDWSIWLMYEVTVVVSC